MSAAVGDVRSFYAALRVPLPDWAFRNAAVRCFADPDAHAHGDSDPSCSVSLESGAWCCHGCGARGGAYDAALALGRSPRQAMELLIANGMAEPRTPSAAGHARRGHLAEPSARAAARARASAQLAVSDAEVERFNRALCSAPLRSLRQQLFLARGWSEEAIRELGIGWDGERITIPIRDRDGQLSGMLRYRDTGAGRKMLAAPGSCLAPIPHPFSERSERILLVEGPPDMIAARSRGWPAIAIPGAGAWKADWAALFAARTVTVVMDSDPAGRQAARRIHQDLQPLAAAVRTIDLAPGRQDGYDLTDWLLSRAQPRRQTCKRSLSPSQTIRH